MKKLLLIAATSTALLTSAASFAETGGFYLKAEGGATKLNAMEFKNDSDKEGVKYKSINSGIFGVGAGYYIMDNVRTELTLNFLLPEPEFKCSATLDKDRSAEYKIKENAKSLLLSGYVDLYDAGIVKFFAGAGVGMAQLQQEATGTETIAGQTKPLEAESFKTANNFAYQLTAGASFNLVDGVRLDFAYSWRDYGETSDKIKETKETKGTKKKTGKAVFRGHNLMAGIRFDL